METLLKDYAYHTIKNKILSCEYAPKMILSEDILCTDLNISRTPIRDAISRLRQENLVRVISKKGIFVREITLNELNDIYDVRLLVEPYAILKFGSHAEKESLKEVRDKFMHMNMSQMTPLEYTESDTKFHRYIFSLTGNTYYNQLYDNISNQNFRISILGGQIPLEKRDKSRQEHIDIMEKMIAEDYQQAADIMEKHILTARQNKYELLMTDKSFSEALTF